MEWCHFKEVTSEQCKLRHPFTAIVSGPTQCGKTTFIGKLIRHRHVMIEPKVERVMYSYEKFQPAFHDMKGVKFIKSGADYELDPAIPTLLIVDDQMESAKDIGRLFSVDSHHTNTSVIFVTHNLFYQSKQFRTAALNAKYLVLFKSPRGGAQIRHLARQVHGGGKEAQLMERAYAAATREAHSYLFIDLQPNADQAMRLRGKILPDEGRMLAGHALSECYNG